MSVETHCRLCGAPSLTCVVDLGEQALGCHYPRPGEDAPRAALTLMRCDECGLPQLSDSVDPQLLYRSGYGYRSGQTATMRKHLADVVAYARREAGDINAVLDIGCNDGTLLGYWNVRERVGFDPLAHAFPQMHGVQVIAEPFSRDACPAEFSGHFDVITACAVLYDVEDPVRFLCDVARVLAPSGIFIAEVMYVGAMLDGAWDHISHEHVTYWDVTHLQSAAFRADLRLCEIGWSGVNGGTLRAVFCHAGEPYQTSSTIDDWIAREERRSEHWGSFAERVAQSGEQLHRELGQRHDKGQTIDVLGASQKGNTVLQYADIRPPLVRWASERDPRKHGFTTPGTGIPIVSEEQSRESLPDAYLVLPWHFKDEILAREDLALRQGVKFIFPLPALTIR